MNRFIKKLINREQGFSEHLRCFVLRRKISFLRVILTTNTRINISLLKYYPVRLSPAHNKRCMTLFLTIYF